VSSEEPLSFNVLSSRKGPARSAAGLVLNRGDGSLCSPVKSCRNIDCSVDLSDSVVGEDAGILRIEWGHEPGVFPLLEVEVREFVDSKGGLGVSHGQFDVSPHVGLEVAETSHVFVRADCVSLVELSHELLEENLILVLVSDGIDNSQKPQDGQNNLHHLR